MTSSTGRWVSGADFFDREAELRILAERVSAGNHVLLTGQRRMGKLEVAADVRKRIEALSMCSTGLSTPHNRLQSNTAPR